MFYSLDAIPVHSCLLVHSYEEAVNYPKGKLCLGFCRKCGFISNACFDDAVHHYSGSYEETQGFSSTFNAFAKSLAQRLIDKYGILNKTILEIGCGKGEFLALMCQLGDNKGIGIDPAFAPQRNPDGDAGRVQFIQDFYSEKYAYLTADVICCRHALEHLPSTYSFMKTLRDSIGERKDTLVFFEVPDVLRVLNEGAFWDIYYEHCSYFTVGSLARLFRSTGFSIDELYLDYDGQYIIIAAYPVEKPNAEILSVENDMDLLTSAFTQFKKICHNTISRWLTLIEDIVNKSQKVVLWGAGSKGVAFLTTLNIVRQIEYVVDINPYKQNTYMAGTGQKIVSPEFLVSYKPDYVIAMNPIYQNEIRSLLNRLGLNPILAAV
jgi:SAM-dependent methyltransferase